MKTCILIIFLIACFSCNYSDTVTTRERSLSKFVDLNNAQVLLVHNDTLFCKTTGGYLYFQSKLKIWQADTSETLPELFSKDSIIANRTSFPDGYETSAYTTVEKIHGTFLLITHGDEGGVPYKQEIVDTLKKVIYKFPFERINDFLVYKGMLWLASYSGISCIDTASLKRVDYLRLPAFKKIKSVYETSDDFFFLDIHYGLFSFSKANQCITPISKVNTLVHDSAYKFLNSCKIGSKLYILCAPMDVGAYYLSGKPKILIYDILSQNLITLNSEVSYFDSFLRMDPYLVCYGEWLHAYEGGSIFYYGGAVALDINKNRIITLTRLPVILLNKKNSALEAINIEDDECHIAYEKMDLSGGFLTQGAAKILEKDTFYTCFDAKYHDGDTFALGYGFYPEKKVVGNRKKYEEYALMLHNIRKQRINYSDSTLTSFPVMPSSVNYPGKPVEKGYYK